MLLIPTFMEHKDFLETFGSQGSGPDQSEVPTGIALDQWGGVTLPTADITV